MNIRMAEIIIFEKKAYVPSNARVPNGLFTSIEPVYLVDSTLDKLLPVVKEVLSTEPRLLPTLTRAEIKAQQDLLPRITGARNWRLLCQRGISYIIEISDKGFLLEMSRLDAKGRWEFDPNKRKTFAPGTDLSVIIQAVLEDLETHII